jgi:hypothetical protein
MTGACRPYKLGGSATTLWCRSLGRVGGWWGMLPWRAPRPKTPMELHLWRSMVRTQSLRVHNTRWPSYSAVRYRGRRDGTRCHVLREGIEEQWNQTPSCCLSAKQVWVDKIECGRRLRRHAGSGGPRTCAAEGMSRGSVYNRRAQRDSTCSQSDWR